MYNTDIHSVPILMVSSCSMFHGTSFPQIQSLELLSWSTISHRVGTMWSHEAIRTMQSHNSHDVIPRGDLHDVILRQSAQCDSACNPHDAIRDATRTMQFAECSPRDIIPWCKLHNLKYSQNTSCRIPVAGYQSRDTNCRIPVGGYQWQDTSRRIPVAGYQSQDASHRRIPVAG